MQLQLMGYIKNNNELDQVQVFQFMARHSKYDHESQRTITVTHRAETH